ncbi:hypothetical protein F8M41_015948 [Gigaspora margarita]|uniref:Uncharacterized protein n=1 Tax=Gigaspora margarita TaxID=4874 RepID=A0A8H3WU32_GIGMA|nr:hypothetical protein F8M41_015948 [Gigaspora margarita]
MVNLLVFRKKEEIVDKTKRKNTTRQDFEQIGGLGGAGIPKLTIRVIPTSSTPTIFTGISLCSVEVVVELSVFDLKLATLENERIIYQKEKDLLIERVALQHAELLSTTAQEAGSQLNMIQKGIAETLHNRNPNAQYQDDDDFQPVVSNSVNRQKRKNLSISTKDKQSNASVKKTKTTIRNKENIDNNTSSGSKSTLFAQFDKSERDELSSKISKEDDEINTFFQTSSSRKLAEMDNKDETVKMNKTGPFLLSESNRKEIEDAYKLMKRENMWKLKSGRFIEEELYKLGLDMRFEHASHSFIVDVDDEAIKQHFNEEECLEIYNASGPEVPQLSQEIIEYLAKFTNKRSLKEVRKAINEPDERFDAKYDKDAYHDLGYIRFALGESTSLANADRKNAQRIMPERRQMGHRSDFTIRKVGSRENDEYGIGEAGKLWIDDHESKFLKESSIKTHKVLKDMLLKLRNKVDDNSIKLQTVGMIHSGADDDNPPS